MQSWRLLPRSNFLSGAHRGTVLAKRSGRLNVHHIRITEGDRVRVEILAVRHIARTDHATTLSCHDSGGFGVDERTSARTLRVGRRSS